MKEFVPVSDEVLDTAPDLFNHLVPYHRDYSCHRAYYHDFEVTPADLQVQIPTSNLNRSTDNNQHEPSEA